LQFQVNRSGIGRSEEYFQKDKRRTKYKQVEFVPLDRRPMRVANAARLHF
jgi:hypothetical protein